MIDKTYLRLELLDNYGNVLYVESIGTDSMLITKEEKQKAILNMNALIAQLEHDLELMI
jgi:hypothetical protein